MGQWARMEARMRWGKGASSLQPTPSFLNLKLIELIKIPFAWLNMCQYVSTLTQTPSFLSWRVGLLGDSSVTCKSRGWGKCQIAHWRNACVSDMGEQETWAGAIDPQPTSSPAQPLHITGEVTWGLCDMAKTLTSLVPEMGIQATSPTSVNV